jgi:hypothetical protein
MTSPVTRIAKASFVAKAQVDRAFQFSSMTQCHYSIKCQGHFGDLPPRKKISMHTTLSTVYQTKRHIRQTNHDVPTRKLSRVWWQSRSNSRATTCYRASTWQFNSKQLRFSDDTYLWECIHESRNASSISWFETHESSIILHDANRRQAPPLLQAWICKQAQCRRSRHVHSRIW